MAASKPTPEAPAEAEQAPTTSPTEYKAEAPSVDGVTLYNRAGESKTLTDPGAIVSAEFSGWSRNKDRFKKRKK